MEASDVATLAKEIVAKNGFDSIIRVVNQKIEDIQEEIAVDIIVSEWMGGFPVVILGSRGRDRFCIAVCLSVCKSLCLV